MSKQNKSTFGLGSGKERIFRVIVLLILMVLAAITISPLYKYQLHRIWDSAMPSSRVVVGSDLWYTLLSLAVTGVYWVIFCLVYKKIKKE